ncbi:MAG: hypothetical protein Q9216_005760 [Gyalolechia sp. 2 TL-2023]
MRIWPLFSIAMTEIRIHQVPSTIQDSFNLYLFVTKESDERNFLKLYYTNIAQILSAAAMSSAISTLTILDLPAEIRTHILSFLLPDLPTIQCDLQWSQLFNDPPRKVSPLHWEPFPQQAPYAFRSDQGPCSLSVLGANRQLYADGKRYLYGGKTYRLNVHNYGFDFLSESDELGELPPLPYSEIKDFVIVIAPSYEASTAFRLRANLLWLCGLLRHNKVHFRRLKVEFDESLRCFWADSWDKMESDYLPPPMIEQDGLTLPNADFLACSLGFTSVFSWFISPLALLPTAGECRIELPAAFKEKRHFVDLAQWYERGISGALEFGELWCLQGDIAEFKQMKKDGTALHLDCGRLDLTPPTTIAFNDHPPFRTSVICQAYHIVEMTSTTVSSKIFTLPTELRARILSYLLPNTPTIECDWDYSPFRTDLPRSVSPATWFPGTSPSVHEGRSDSEKCYTEILRTNSRLYADGITYLYSLKTYKLTVFQFGFDFLNQSGPLRQLPPLPYHEMKEFVIQLADCDVAEMGCRLRYNILWLCGLLRQHGVHFKKLGIEFLGDRWRKAWDATESEVPDSPQLDDVEEEVTDLNVIAYRNGFASTVEFLLSPLALLPTSGECRISLPCCLKEKEHMIRLAKWYEEGIDGTFPFEDDGCLMKDVEDFEWLVEHPDGFSTKCGCYRNEFEEDQLDRPDWFDESWKSKFGKEFSSRTIDHREEVSLSDFSLLNDPAPQTFDPTLLLGRIVKDSGRPWTGAVPINPELALIFSNIKVFTGILKHKKLSLKNAFASGRIYDEKISLDLRGSSDLLRNFHRDEVCLALLESTDAILSNLRTDPRIRESVAQWLESNGKRALPNPVVGLVTGVLVNFLKPSRKNPVRTKFAIRTERVALDFADFPDSTIALVPSGKSAFGTPPDSPGPRNILKEAVDTAKTSKSGIFHGNVHGSPTGSPLFNKAIESAGPISDNRSLDESKQIGYPSLPTPFQNISLLHQIGSVTQPRTRATTKPLKFAEEQCQQSIPSDLLDSSMEDSPETRNMGLLSDTHQSKMKTRQYICNWELLAYMSDQFDSWHPISSMVTLTGTETVAEATTCGDYVSDLWPNGGDALLSAIDQYRTLSRSDISVTTWGIDIRLRTKRNSKTARIDVTCASFNHHCEVMSTLRWLAATFRSSPFSVIAKSRASLLDDPDLYRTTSPEIIFDLTLDELEPVETSAMCWYPLFPHTPMAVDFPARPRIDGVGLAISPALMASMAGIIMPVEYHGGFILKGLSATLVPIRACDGGAAIQWHLFPNQSADGSFDLRTPESGGSEVEFLRVEEPKTLFEKKAYLGWCKEANILLGTDQSNYAAVNWSGSAPEQSRFTFSGFALGISSSGMGAFGPSATMNFAVAKNQRARFMDIEQQLVDRLRLSISKPALIYDTATQRGWLTPITSLLLHMMHLRHRELTKHTSSVNTEPMPYANTLGEGGKEAYEVLATYLRPRSRTPLGSCTIWRDTLAVLCTALDMALKDARDVKDKVSRNGDCEIYGFELLNIVRAESPFRFSERKVQKQSGGWALIAQQIGYVLFCSNLGEALVPGGSANHLCQKWMTVPPDCDYLCAYVPCIEEVLEQQGKHRGVQMLHDQRHQQTLYEECKHKSGQRCSHLKSYHALLEPSKGTCETTSTEARENGMSFASPGALIFGKFTKLSRRTMPITAAENGNALAEKPQVNVLRRIYHTHFKS